jgi:hypothetical protein
MKRYAWGHEVAGAASEGEYFVGTVSAKAFVEKQRRRGVRWFINELPVLVLHGGQASLLVLDRYAARPFAELPRPKARWRSLGEAFAWFRELESRVMIMFTADSSAVASIGPSVAAWMSEPQQGARALYWHRVASEIDTRAIQEFRTAVCFSGAA